MARPRSHVGYTRMDLNEGGWHSWVASMASRRIGILIAMVFTIVMIAVSFRDTIEIDSQWYQLLPKLQEDRPQPLADGIPMRVLFLGASVTRGDVSTGNVGFRKPIHDKFVEVGNPVNFVGSLRLGEFVDNDVEAYPGNRIDQAHEHAKDIVPQTKPNVVVLHMGSNDCLQHRDTPNLGERMHQLINYILAASPRATIIMSTLMTNTVPNAEPCILDVNIQIRKLASLLQREGKPVVMAETHSEQGLPDRPVPSDISPDGTHPYDPGYQMLAEIFWDAIVEADERGFYQPPEENGVPLDGESERPDEIEMTIQGPGDANVVKGGGEVKEVVKETAEAKKAIEGGVKTRRRPRIITS